MLARTGVGKISSVACWFSPIKIYFSDYLKSLNYRINEALDFLIKYRYNDILLINHSFIYNRLFFCIHTCYCLKMFSVTPASLYVSSANVYKVDTRCTSEV